METIPLVENYYARKVEKEEFDEVFKQNRAKMFNESVDFKPYAMISETEREKLRLIFQAMHFPNALHYLVEQDGQLVGWSYGFQDTKEEFYMCNSGIFKAHRRKGIYSKLLKIIMDEAIAIGYQIIHSKHALTNNAVIIPKLKAGFMISGISLEDKFGALVKLVYYTNKDRTAVMRFRSGEEALPKELAEYGHLIKGEIAD